MNDDESFLKWLLMTPIRICIFLPLTILGSAFAKLGIILNPLFSSESTWGEKLTAIVVLIIFLLPFIIFLNHA